MPRNNLMTHKQVFAMYGRTGGHRAWSTWNEFLNVHELVKCDICGMYGELGDPIQPVNLKSGDDYYYYCSDRCGSILVRDYGDDLDPEDLDYLPDPAPQGRKA